MRVAGHQPLRLLLRTLSGERREPGLDAADRRACICSIRVGRPRLTAVLRREGLEVNQKRVGRLMRVMGWRRFIASLVPARRSPGTRLPVFIEEQGHYGARPGRGARDITYIPMRHGFMYLMRGDGRVEPVRAGVGVEQHAGGGFCVQAWQMALAREINAAHLQHGTRGRSSPPPSMSGRWSKPGFRSAWTDAAGGWTTGSSNGCGGASSMRTSTCADTSTG